MIQVYDGDGVPPDQRKPRCHQIFYFHPAELSKSAEETEDGTDFCHFSMELIFTETGINNRHKLSLQIEDLQNAKQEKRRVNIGIQFKDFKGENDCVAIEGVVARIVNRTSRDRMSLELTVRTN